MVQGEPCKDCYVHEKVEEEIHAVRTVVEARGKIIDSKLPTWLFCWVIGGLVSLTIVIFGVLWHGQATLSTNQFTNHRTIMEVLAEIKTNAAVAAVKSQITADKLDDHMREWPTMQRKQSDQPNPRTGK